jgi:hypothetical protein
MNFFMTNKRTPGGGQSQQRKSRALTAILKSEGLITDDVTSSDKFKVLDALVVYQQSKKDIPVAEYGNPRSARRSGS